MILRYKLSSIPIKKGHPYFAMDIISSEPDGSCIVEIRRQKYNKHTIEAFKRRGVEKVEFIGHINTLKEN